MFSKWKLQAFSCQRVIKMIQYIWIPLSCYWFTLKKIYFGCHWNKMFKGKVQICGDVLTMRIAYSSVNDIGIFSWNLVIDSTIVFFHLLNRLEWGGLFTSIRSVSLLIKTNCYDKCILERVVVTGCGMMSFVDDKKGRLF